MQSVREFHDDADLAIVCSPPGSLMQSVREFHDDADLAIVRSTPGLQLSVRKLYDDAGLAIVLSHSGSLQQSVREFHDDAGLAIVLSAPTSLIQSVREFHDDADLAIVFSHSGSLQLSVREFRDDAGLAIVRSTPVSLLQSVRAFPLGTSTRHTRLMLRGSALRERLRRPRGLPPFPRCGYRGLARGGEQSRPFSMAGATATPAAGDLAERAVANSHAVDGRSSRRTHRLRSTGFDTRRTSLYSHCNAAVLVHVPHRRRFCNLTILTPYRVKCARRGASLRQRLHMRRAWCAGVVSSRPFTFR
jgi:hypothetical protein